MQNLVKQKPTLAWTGRMNEGDNLFSRSMIAKSDKVLDTYLHNLSKAKETQEIWKAIETVVKGFDKLNMEDDGFIETAEREELVDFIKNAAESYGLHYEGDVTEEFRTEW
jgi:hypothetical protein